MGLKLIYCYDISFDYGLDVISAGLPSVQTLYQKKRFWIPNIGLLLWSNEQFNTV